MTVDMTDDLMNERKAHADAVFRLDNQLTQVVIQRQRWEERAVAAEDRIEQLVAINEALTAKVKLMDDLDVINGEKIEALTKERDEAMQLLQTLSNMNGDLSRDMYKTKLLLAKAVELGDKMAKSIEGNYYTPGLVGEWRATLAEIEGEKL